jgi:hypothetical protein
MLSEHWVKRGDDGMTRGLSKVVPVALLAILGAAVTACGGGPTSTAAPTATATVTVTADPQTSAATPTPRAAPKNPRDRLACDKTETLMAKMTTAANGWVPATRPFDSTVGTKIRLLTVDMAAAERLSGTAPVRATLKKNTAAFTSLAKAMAGTRKEKVFSAVGKTQVAYAQFKSACGVT